MKIHTAAESGAVLAALMATAGGRVAGDEAAIARKANLEFRVLASWAGGETHEIGTFGSGPLEEGGSTSGSMQVGTSPADEGPCQSDVNMNVVPPKAPIGLLPLWQVEGTVRRGGMDDIQVDYSWKRRTASGLGSAPDAAYFRAWMEWGTGDTATAKELLVRAGVIPERGPAPEVARAVALDSAGNEPAAFAMLMEGLRRHSLDPRVHAALADLRLHQAPDDPQARLEAVAARVLAPQDGLAWLRWGAIQADDGRHSQAVRSLERALALGIGSPEREKQIRDAIDELRTMLPGGSLAQQELHRVADEKKARAGGGRQP